MEEINALKTDDDYQVFVLGSKMSFPYTLFAIHAWFVTINKGVVERWDIWGYKTKHKASWGFLHKDLYPPMVGVRKHFFSKPDLNVPRFKGKILQHLCGKEGSEVEKIVKFISKSYEKYPFTEKYNMIMGPNSNTFPQWVMDHFPNSGLKLPFTAWGKNYKYE